MSKRSIQALLAMLLVMVLVGGEHVFSSPEGPGAVPLAVYRGSGTSGARGLATYERFVGRSVDYVIEYLDVDTTENQEWPTWQADAWRSNPRRLVLGSTGVGPESGFSWEAAARGEYDSSWRRLGERLVASGQEDAILRGAHEFNGDWFFYRVREGQEQTFIAAWRRWVGVMRSVPGHRFSFDWNPIVGQVGLDDPSLAYPGDEYVDRIAIDVYDGYYERGFVPDESPPSDDERAALWEQLLDGPFGLRFWQDFAVERDKPMSFPEWGIRTWQEQEDGRVHGGGDNPHFVRRMHELISDPAWRVDYHGFWEDPADGGAGVSDPDSGRAIPVPLSRASFLELFGGRRKG